tara:strand:- start:26 stop:343 length:318 start_codon:yes stop_codon:yes gene_type:complete
MLSHADLALDPADAATLFISVPQCADYDIAMDETIAVEVAGGALSSAVDAPVTPGGPANQLVIRALPGSAELTGSLLLDADVSSIQSPSEATLQARHAHGMRPSL